MKPSFRYIVITIITALCLVFLFQLYWLGGLYQTTKQETDNIIQKCISDANMDELEFRIDSLDKSNKSEEKTIAVTSTWGNDEDSNSGSKRTKRVISENDTITVERKDSLGVKLKDIGNLIVTLSGSIHQALDTIAPIHLNTLRSLIDRNIQGTSINTKVYGIDVLNVGTDKVLYSNMDSTFLSKTESKIYIYDPESNLAYRVYIDPLTKNILYQMSGILTTTALIILILGFAFWYLIRTIMNLKTLEQMKDDFTNNMTHELKTPIAVAYSATDALLNFGHGENKERREKYLTICKNQLSELSERVEQILSMSMEHRRVFMINKEEIDISNMINNLITQYKLKYEEYKNITFDLDITPAGMNVTADRIHLNNILSNLIDNAIKYSATAVTISIRVYQDKESNIIEINDNGTGIPPDKLPYIFDKFYRVTYGNKYNTKGYGLGLFYVKTMVEKHGGSVLAESKLDKGSKFTIKIPQ